MVHLKNILIKHTKNNCYFLYITSYYIIFIYFHALRGFVVSLKEKSWLDKRERHILQLASNYMKKRRESSEE